MRPNARTGSNSRRNSRKLDQIVGLIVMLIVAALLLLVFHFKVSFAIAVDILEHCPLLEVKDAACKVYENLGLLTALVLTTVPGMLLDGHEIEAYHPCLAESQSMQRKAFVVLCVACLISSIVCVVLCLLNHFYLGSLSEATAVDFMIDNGAGIGEAILWAVLTYFLLWAACFWWASSNYGLSVGFWTIGSALLGAMTIGVRWRAISHYDPERKRKNGTSTAPSPELQTKTFGKLVEEEWPGYTGVWCRGCFKIGSDAKNESGSADAKTESGSTDAKPKDAMRPPYKAAPVEGNFGRSIASADMGPKYEAAPVRDTE